jgi:hypothetical protein
MQIITREDLRIANVLIARATAPKEIAVVPDGPVITAGIIDAYTLAWLEEHGATIIDSGVVMVVALPERAIIDNQGHWWSYTVSIFDENETEIGPGLTVEMDVDVRHSMVTLCKANAA